MSEKPVTKRASNGTSQKDRSPVTVCLVHLGWGGNPNDFQEQVTAFSAPGTLC